VSLLIATSSDVTAKADLNALAEGLGSALDSARQRWQVPAVAVVLAAADGCSASVVRGHVSARIDATPATSQTLFPLASGTKAMTAFLLVQAAAAGRLSLDAPLASLRPALRLGGDSAANERLLTLRDLLAHRSGWPRHDAVWYGSPLSREALLARLPHLVPTAPPRQRWLYQNLLYTLAADCLRDATASGWEQAIRQQLFEPLQMLRAGTDAAAFLADANHAEGSRLADDLSVHTEAHQPLDAMAPCGGVHLCADDLARWLVLLAARGAPLVPRERFDELWRSEIRVGPALPWPEMADTYYGLGFFVTRYRGDVLVHHGGNLPGASSMTAFLPEHGLALGILCSGTQSLLRDAWLYRLVDKILGRPPIDWDDRFMALRSATLQAKRAGQRHAGLGAGSQRADTAQQQGRPDELVGRWRHAGYGDVEVSQVGSQLQLDHNGFVTPLLPLHHDSFDTPQWEHSLGRTRVQAQRNSLGDIAALVLHLEPELPGIAFVRVAEPLAPATRAALRPWLGSYTIAGGELTLETAAPAAAALQLRRSGQPAAALTALATLPMGEVVRRWRIEGAIEQTLELVGASSEPDGLGVVLHTRSGSHFFGRASEPSA
jgi:CubicO group peptidase (beta-lactamase class C family)